MPLADPVLTPLGAGRSREYGSGSNLELKLYGEQSSGDRAVVENTVRAGDEPPIHTHTREDESIYVLEGAIVAYVLLTLHPAGAEYFSAPERTRADLRPSRMRSQSVALAAARTCARASG